MLLTVEIAGAAAPGALGLARWRLKAIAFSLWKFLRSPPASQARYRSIAAAALSTDCSDRPFASRSL